MAGKAIKVLGDDRGKYEAGDDFDECVSSFDVT